jgi:hypothetical protein
MRFDLAGFKFTTVLVKLPPFNGGERLRYGRCQPKEFF